MIRANLLKITSLFFLLLLLQSHMLFGQDPFNERFEGGKRALSDILMMNLIYPDDAHDNKKYGTSLAQIALAPSGETTFILINSLDHLLDEEVLRVLELTRDNWLPTTETGDTIMLYIPVVFETSPEQIRLYASQHEHFFSPVTVKGYMPSLPEDEQYMTNFNQAIQNKNYEIALINLKELIRRNPLNKEYYQISIQCKRLLHYPAEEYAHEIEMLQVL